MSSIISFVLLKISQGLAPLFTPLTLPELKTSIGGEVILDFFLAISLLIAWFMLLRRASLSSIAAFAALTLLLLSDFVWRKQYLVGTSDMVGLIIYTLYATLICISIFFAHRGGRRTD
jgi:hypothetical protein